MDFTRSSGYSRLDKIKEEKWAGMVQNWGVLGPVASVSMSTLEERSCRTLDRHSARSRPQGRSRRRALPPGRSIAHALYLLTRRKYLNMIAGLLEGHYSPNCHKTRNSPLLPSRWMRYQRASWPDREEPGLSLWNSLPTSLSSCPENGRSLLRHLSSSHRSISFTVTSVIFQFTYRCLLLGSSVLEFMTKYLYINTKSSEQERKKEEDIYGSF